MTTKKSYYELLKHPKWQRMRLEILERANFECEYCGGDDVTLNVHHSYYQKGLAPWEYPAESLHCLCENCHKEAQDRHLLLQRQMGRIGLGDTDQLFGYALGLEAHSSPTTPLDVYSYEVALGIADCWGLSAEEVIDALQDGKVDGDKLEKLRQAKRTR